MHVRSRSTTRLLSRASTLAIIAALSAAGRAQAACDTPLVLNGPGPDTISANQECVDVTGTTSAVTNNATIGDPGDGDPAFFVGGEGSITGALTNNGTITGATGILIETATFGGDIVNSAAGHIEGFGLGGAAIWVDSLSFNGDITNSGVIDHGESFDQGGGVRVASDTWTGNFANLAGGSIDGGLGINGAFGNAGNFVGNFSNAGHMFHFYEFNEEPEGSGVSVGSSVTGNFTNSGTVEGGESGFYIDPLEAFPFNVGSFIGNFSNSGAIRGQMGSGLHIELLTFTGNITNTAAGTIEGGDEGVNVEAGVFQGNFLNQGSITGGLEWSDSAGVDFDNWGAWTYTGNFTNSGTISGSEDGVNIGFSGPSDDTVYLDTFTGAFLNSGTIEGGEYGLRFGAGTLAEGSSIVNSGTISGATAVYLEIGNGATFTNSGTILGDVVFGGKAPYDFVGEGGGIEGDLFGAPNFYYDEEEETFVFANDDTISVNGTHFFSDDGGEGAHNFLAFDVNAGGVAVLGARFVGDPDGSGYDSSNIDAVNVNAGGALYLDKRTELQTGTYTQAPGGALMYYIAAPGIGTTGVAGTDYGMISAGSASIGGATLAIVPDVNSFSASAESAFDYFGIIQTETGVAGEFAANDAYFFQLTPTYTETSVDLHVVRRPFDDVSCSSSYGEALEQLFQQGDLTLEQQQLLQYLAQLSESEVCAAYGETGGAAIADVAAAVVENASPFKANVAERVNAAGAGGCMVSGDGSCFNRFAQTGATQVMSDATPGDDPFAWLKTGVRRQGETAAWGRIVGVLGETDGAGATGGTDFLIAGAIAGVDHVFTPILLAGVAVQVTTNDVDFQGQADEADVDSLEAGAYVSYGDTRLYINANASFTWHDFDVRRFAGGLPAFGDYGGTTVSAYAEGGKIFEHGAWRIQPLVALSFAHLDTDSYSESGTAIGLLDVAEADFDTLKGVLGSRVAHTFALKSGRKLVPEARIAWAHEFLDDHTSFVAATQGGGAPFLVEGAARSRDTLLAGAGLTAPVTAATTLFFDYDAGLNEDVTTHALAAGVRTRW